MELCQDSREEVRIHSYNILRVLFRDSSLGEVVSPFVSDGLRAAILGFKASEWPVSIFIHFCTYRLHKFYNYMTQFMILDDIVIERVM